MYDSVVGDENPSAEPSTDATAAGTRDLYPLKAVLASVVGYGIDGFDTLILSFTLVAITGSLHLSTSQSGSLATVTLWGAVVGGVTFGLLSDRVGRVRVLMWSILLFAAFTALAALSRDYAELAASRFVAGIGLGGEFGIGMTLAAEAWPAAKRARATSYVALGWQAGVLVAAVSTALLLPHVGWRGMFAIAAVPAVVAFFARRAVAEPEKFREMRRSDTRRFALTELVSSGERIRSTAGLLILASVQNLGYYGLMTWLPSYLAKQFGYTLTKSVTWTAVTVLGMAVGIVIFGQFADRVGRRPALMVFMAGAAISVLAYSRLTASLALLIGGAVMGIFVNGMLGGYGALLAELFPTNARATAENVIFNVGRGVGGFGPLLIATLATRYSFSMAIAILAGLYVIDLVAAFALISERRGLELA